MAFSGHRPALRDAWSREIGARLRVTVQIERCPVSVEGYDSVIGKGPRRGLPEGSDRIPFDVISFVRPCLGSGQPPTRRQHRYYSSFQGRISERFLAGRMVSTHLSGARTSQPLE